jgi:KipI family sensor histidine kinase inhibitor
MLARMDTWVWQGERGLLRTFDGTIAEANAVARAASEALRAGGFPEVADVVPGARTVLVELLSGAEPSDALVRALEAEPPKVAATDGQLHEMAVTYDGEDLAAIAALRAMRPEDVIEFHTSVEYTVAFIGFQPGFPYLLGLPEQLAVPRLSSPRVKVDRGSVAIGGEYTGIYPSATPGGWRLVGHTNAVLFDPTRTPPSLLAPGDRVRFVRA